MAISYNMSPEWFDKTALSVSLAVFNEISDMQRKATEEVDNDKTHQSTRRPATREEYWENALPFTRK